MSDDSRRRTPQQSRSWRLGGSPSPARSVPVSFDPDMAAGVSFPMARPVARARMRTALVVSPNPYVSTAPPSVIPGGPDELDARRRRRRRLDDDRGCGRGNLDDDLPRWGSGRRGRFGFGRRGRSRRRGRGRWGGSLYLRRDGHGGRRGGRRRRHVRLDLAPPDQPERREKHERRPASIHQSTLHHGPLGMWRRRARIPRGQPS
jgi:hypothetical protein